MKKFSEILEDVINEKLITFGNKRPKYGNVVILAGGGGSGKGFIIDKLIGSADYKIFNVDDLKMLAKESKILQNRLSNGDYGEQYKNVKLKELDLTDKSGKPTELLHQIVKDMGLQKKQFKAFKNVMLKNPKYRPNIIFDVTLKDMGK